MDMDIGTEAAARTHGETAMRQYGETPGTADACRHADICGGCVYQGVPYDEQLATKDGTVRGCLAEYGIEPLEYRPMRAAGARFRYRNKMEYSFGDEVKGGPMTLGIHRQGSYMSVINTDECLIVPEPFNNIREAVLDWALRRGYGFHHKRSHSGFLRSLVIRRGDRTGELLVNIVTTSEEALDEEGFCEAVFGAGDRASDAIGASEHGDARGASEHGDAIVGILHTINDRRADIVACDSVKTLYGRDYYCEKLLGLDFRVGAFSFFQTNIPAVESMLGEALAFIPDRYAESLYDIYCGTGAISLALSKRTGHVTGIELNKDSVLSARENAALNGIENASFICGDAFDILKGLPAPDMLAVDPPRMGLHPKALRRVIEYNLPALLYISCNPKTFAENAAVLKTAGYRVSLLGAYDNFPFTRHIELAALIEKQ